MHLSSGHFKYLQYSAYNWEIKKQRKKLRKFLRQRGVPSSKLWVNLLAEFMGNLYNHLREGCPQTASWREYWIPTPLSALRCPWNGYLMASLSIADVFNFIIFIVLKLSITWDPKPEMWNNCYQFVWKLYNIGRLPREFLVCWKAFHWACSRRAITEWELVENKAVFGGNIFKASCPLLCL